MSSHQIRPTAAQLDQQLQDYLRQQGFDDQQSSDRDEEAGRDDQDADVDGGLGLDWPSAAKVYRHKPPKVISKAGKDNNKVETDSGSSSLNDKGKAREQETEIDAQLLPSTSTPSSDSTTFNAKVKEKVLRFAPTVQASDPPKSNPISFIPHPSSSTSSNPKPLSRFAQQRAAQAASRNSIDSSHSDSETGSRQAKVEDGNEEEERVEVDSQGRKIDIPPIPKGPSIIGGVKERPISSHDSGSSSNTNKGGDGGGGSVLGSIVERNPEEKERNPFGYRGFPTISRIITNPDSNQEAAPGSDEVWLDEDGEPMSAFRKSRLIKQGLGPPNRKSGGNQTKSNSNSSTSFSGSNPNVSRGSSVFSALSNPIKERRIIDEEVEKEPKDEISRILKSVSDENDEKLKGMGKEELENEVESVQNLFSEEILEMLRKRGEEKYGNGNSKRPLNEAPISDQLVRDEDNLEVEEEIEQQDPSRDPGGGADPLTISEMLQSVSRENDEKLKGMSKDELESERTSLENLFGSDVLEKLKKRGEGKVSHDQKVEKAELGETKNKTQSKRILKPSVVERNQELEEGEEFEGSTKDIRNRFFPQENESNPSLEWMNRSLDSNSAVSDVNASSSIRFDFNGDSINQSLSKTKDSTYLAGLHHHEKDQSSPGYTLEELLHLTRSSVPSQRSLAFSVLGRICIKYPSVKLVSSENKVDNGNEDGELGKFEISKSIDDENLRAKVSIFAKVSLDDRQRNVAVQALGCLRAAIVSDSIGPRPISCFDSTSFNGSSITSSKDPKSQGPNQDWISHLIEFGLINSLSSLAPKSRIGINNQDSTTSEDQNIFLTLLDILLVLASRSIKACDFIMKEKALIDMIVGRGIKPSWPSSISSSTSKTNTVIAPNSSAVKLIGILASSSRDSAERLVYEGSIESLMRILTFFSWMMEDENEDRTDENSSIEMEWTLLKNVLEVYTILGNYGMFSPIYMRISTLLTPIRDSAGTILKEAIEKVGSNTEESANLVVLKLEVVKQLLSLIEVWTISASDPNHKDEEGRVVWQQVSDWSDFSLKNGPTQTALGTLESTSGEMTESDRSILRSIVGVAGASARHFSAYIKASSNWNSSSSHQSLESSVPDFRAFNFPASFISGEIPRLARIYKESRTKSEPFWFQSQVQAQELANLCKSATGLLALKFRLEETMIENVIKHMLKRTAGALLEDDIWEDFEKVEPMVCGIQALRRSLVGLITASLSDRNQLQGNPRIRSEKVSMSLSVLQVLQPGDEEIALEIIENLVQAVNPMVEELKSSTSSANINPEILMPFFKECLRSSTDQDGNPESLIPPLQPTYESLRSIRSLFIRIHSESTSSNTNRGEDGEEKEIPEHKIDLDPLTGAPLWKSPASGLPLRRDWTLLAIDDLLESAESAALNRSGNLPADWNSSEEEIVRSSLALSIVILESTLSSTRKSKEKALPSASEILFALMKVYKLEESNASAPGSKATGNLTGKDLFREPSISKMISRLISLSSRVSSYLPSSSSSTSTLETVSLNSLPETIPFYQFYTDLLELYDSISFGDESFGQLIILPISMRYPKDYRKLLWSDYASSIKTISTKIKDLPLETENGIWDFLQPIENGDEILKCYLDALVNVGIDREGSELLYNIALHHLIYNIWPTTPQSEQEKDQDIHKSRYLARVLFKSSNPKLRIDSLLYDGRRQGEEKRSGLKRLDKEDEIVKERLNWLAKNLGEVVAGDLWKLVSKTS